MDADQLSRIAWRATPLWNRQPPTTIRAATVNSAKARKRLGRWRDVLGGARILRSRLRGSAVPFPALQRLLGSIHREVELPSWAMTLDEVLRHYSASVTESHSSRGSRDRSYDPRAPLPFQDVLVGFVRYAREEVKARAGPALGVLCFPALVAFERQLLAHLTFVASLTMGHDYYAYRFHRAPVSALETVWHQQAPSSRIYRAYVGHMRTGGLAELLDSHPVLARLLCQSVEQWIGAVADFCSRFLDDFTALRSLFAWRIDKPLGAVAHIRADLSDRHRGGRTVLACELSSGEHVVYKPRTLQPEKAFYCFINWLNQRGLSLKLKSLRLLDRVTHGWMEAVEFAPCRSVSEVQRFYRRAGMLLAAFHALATTDVHRENLIASGEHPVAVDLETLLNDGVRAWPQPTGLGPTDDKIFRVGPSVMSIGMLPFWQTSAEEDQCDMSALGSDDTQDPGIRAFVWDAINTDQMMMSTEAVAATGMTHRVQLDGQRPSALEHLSNILDGFREVYACLVENRKRLISEKRLLSAFDGLNLRVLVRSTVTYTRLQLYSLHPEFLQDGVDRSIELEWLARPLSPRAYQEGPRRLYECERAAMEQLDVPHFATNEWRGTGHTFDDEEMRTLFNERDSQVVLRRLQGLSEADCQRQVAIIKKAVRLRFAT
jgi:type 2 lantibiotic biosynthesis protein LanM